MGKPLESIEEDEVYYKFTFKKEDNSIFKVLRTTLMAGINR